MAQLRTNHDDAYYIALLAECPGISESSKQTYIGSMRFFQGEKINKKLSICDLLRRPALYVPNTVIESMHAQLIRINAILKIMRLMGLNEYECKATGWVKRQEKLLKITRDLTERNIPSQRQSDSMLDWKDVLKAPNRYAMGSDEHLLLTVYITFTRRQADYWKVAIHNGTKGGNPLLDHSFVHIGIKRPYIYLDDFKTVKVYGAFRADLPKEFVDSLKASLLHSPREYLFCRNGRSGIVPFPNKNSYQKWSNSLLHEIFKNKQVTVGTLRHAHATYINQDVNITYFERKRLAYTMAHSVEMQLKYMKIYD